MYNTKTLKNNIIITETAVECPVINCTNYVKRQCKQFKSSSEFLCKKHNIYISPSTIEYTDYKDNLLWKDNSDITLLNEIKNSKRESRMSRDNSEDSLSWNIFRYLEKENLIADYLNLLANKTIINPHIIYWSYSQIEKKTCPLLQSARNEFELYPSKGSEPDIMIICDNALFIIEAKLNASNDVKCKNIEVKDKYISGGQNLWQNIFKSSFEDACIANEKYELSRFWLLGTWIAKKLKIDFYLVSLVRQQKDKDIELNFKKHISENSNRKFLRNTWEDIYNFLIENKISNDSKNTILDYFRTKTIGYSQGKLKKAFVTK